MNQSYPMRNNERNAAVREPPFGFQRNPQSEIRNLKSGFTLIELLAVVVLLALAATLVAVRMDSFSDGARIRSAVGSIETHLRLAAQEARLRGEPRRIEYTENGQLVISAPMLVGDVWQWNEGRSMQVGGGMEITRVLQADEDQAVEMFSVRINPDGRYPAHGFILRRGDVSAGAVMDRVMGARWAMLGDAAVTSLEELQSLLEADDAKP